MSVGIDELVKSRKDNLDYLKKKGIEPYPYSFAPTIFSTDFKQKYDSKLNAGDHTQDKVTVAGRVMAKRNFGKLYFVSLQDHLGRIQIVVSDSDAGAAGVDLIDHIDVGDFLGIDGTVMKTKKGELSVLARKITFLSKALSPYPEKWHGLTDIETRYRKRPLDLIMNPQVKNVFIKRAKIILLVRKYLEQQGFLEVEIPLLQPNYGGANARPFITKSHAWKSDFYLSISPELYLKRLIIGGFDKVYTICKNFRNEDVDKTHNPEFTMMECYASYWDYNDVMRLTESLFEYVAKELYGTTKVTYEGKEIDFKAPWKRVTMKQSIKEHAKLDVDKLSDADLKKILKENELEADPFKRGLAIAEIFAHFCEDKLIAPTFVIDHPKETTPLCKPKRGDPQLIERFEVFVNGWELSNAYSELNDAELQEFFFREQADQGRGKGETHPPDEDFVDSMRYGMPPTGGLGIGIDRLVMLFTNEPTIKDVILFPQMRPERKQQAAEPPKTLQETVKTNKTKLLFQQDPYLKESSAVVRKVEGNEVYLDQTIFFAFSGGQKSDKGKINEVALKDVVLKDDDIAHVFDSSPKLKVGDKVKLKLDWENRFKTMRLHSASHIVDHFLKKEAKITGMSGSLVDSEKDRSTYLVAEKIAPEVLKKVEEGTNKFFTANHKILRYSDKQNPNVWVWECAGIKQLCSGTHVLNTKEIGKIKLKREGKGAGKELVETYLADKV